jgi:hypothetical protein
MAIDKSGTWWVGGGVDDLDEYLRELKVEGYDVDVFRRSACECGGLVFRLGVDQDEGAARLTCTACSKVRYIGDSEQYFVPENVEPYECVECHGDTCNVGVGFSLYEATSTDVRWLSLGVRCPTCGILGCIVDWKVGGGNEPDFLDRV